MKFHTVLACALCLLCNATLIGGADSQISAERQTLDYMQANAQTVYDILRAHQEGRREADILPAREISVTNNSTLTFLFSVDARRILAAILHRPHPENVTPAQAHNLRMEQSWRNIAADSTRPQDPNMATLRRASITNGRGLDGLMRQDVAVQDLVMRLLTIAAQEATDNRGLPAGQQ